MEKVKKRAFKRNVFIYCETKKEAKKLLKLCKNNLKLSFLHEKSTAVFEYEPDPKFWDNAKGNCYYSLYYRKMADIQIVKSLNGTIINFKDVIKKKKD